MRFFECFPQVARYYWVEFEWAFSVADAIQLYCQASSVQLCAEQFRKFCISWRYPWRGGISARGLRLRATLPATWKWPTSESENPVAIIACPKKTKPFSGICWTLAPDRPVIPQQKPTGPGAKILRDLEDSSWGQQHALSFNPIGFMNCYTVTIIQTVS